MAVTGAIYNHLIFGNVNSADYGIYITGEAVYNAPSRAVDMITVPGRNGAVALDQGRFENIVVTYPAGTFGDDQADFRTALSDFRNAILSQRGYQRLEDTYHPDEYRMGIYVEPIEVDPVHYGEAGQFTLSFNCKPQRFLTSGETAITVSDGDTVTNPTLFESSPLLMVKGYGEISFNGYAIEITPEFLGETDIYIRNTTFPWSLNKSLYNDGDTIYFSVKVQTDIYITDPSAAFDVYEEWTKSDSGVPGASTYYKSPNWITVETYIGKVEIDSSQSCTFTHTFNGNVSVSGSMYTLTIVLSFDYDKATGSIDINFDNTRTTFSFAGSRNSRTFGRPSIIADSTKTTLGDPTYIDCDIGSAYLLENDVPVSLDRYIDMGSDLPTLKGGANTVTISNTVTELKIAPRWWKV